MLITSFLLKHLWKDFLIDPVLVTEDSDQIPVQKISFPGVAVCSVNKISKRKAKILAENLFRITHQYQKMYSESEILENIKLFADLYDYNLSDRDRHLSFQKYLDDYLNLTTTEIIGEVIKLVPKCDETLLKCVWGGIEYNCDELLQSRITFDGRCCLFNYIPTIKNKNYRKEKIFEKLYARGAGVNKGLQLTLKDNTDDYFVTTTETNGYLIYIFNPKDFPDKSSGDLTEVIANFGKETFISIEASVISGTDDIRILPTGMRNCIRSEERKTEFGNYRQSDCFAQCRLHAIESLCRCKPFTQPLDVSNYCTLSDLQCMNKYKTKWNNYFPYAVENLEALEFEKYESIRCSECLPSCEHVTYKVSVDQTDTATNLNNAIVSIFFNRPTAMSFKIDVQQTWYEMVSSFGGYLSLLMGLSFINLIEFLILIYKILFYFFRYFLKNIYRKSKKETKRKFLP
ncbi:sodium channel protein Nach-like [Diorhabda carinulata]|uniref:sodium channel protein Nach-like n=1 Tax=Diorhabda carinulata TaxID=1163345 RepID=UPI00259FE490|nr:sodium channel protein Nach-like [Diorhabda carinulata]